MSTAAIISVQIESDEAAGTLAARLSKPASAPHDGIRALIQHLRGIITGSKAGKVAMAIDTATNVTRASGAFTFSAIAVAGQKVQVGATVLTWAASAASENEVTVGGDQAASQANLAAAINAHSALLDIVTAAVVGSTVVVTATRPGKAGNAVFLGAYGTQSSGTITYTSTGPVADETITVAGQAFTFKASASLSTEITRSNTPTTVATNTVAKINAHPVVGSKVVATNAAGVVTIKARDQYNAVLGDGIALAEAGTNTAVSGATLASGAVPPITCAVALSGASSSQSASNRTWAIGTA